MQEVANPQELIASTVKAGKAAAPAAAAVLIAAFDPGAGLYDFELTTEVGPSATVAKEDLANIRLNVEGVAIAYGINGQKIRGRLQLGATDSILVDVVGNATAATVYTANLTLTKVRGGTV